MVVSEIITTKKISLFNNLNLDNCFLEFTPTKTSGCDTLLYITNHLLYKFRNNLNIYEKNVLESTLIEIVKPKNQILVWESFTDIQLWILLTLIAIA